MENQVYKIYQNKIPPNMVSTEKVLAQQPGPYLCMKHNAKLYNNHMLD